MDELIKKYSEYAEANGFQLNPDRVTVERIVKGLMANKENKGKEYCPCRRLSGIQEEDDKKVCPCAFHKDEIAKDGRCLCGLFTKI